MYPEFIADAEVEEEKKALTSFKWAYEVEKEHEVLFRQALEALGKEAGELEIYVCPVCGHTHVGLPPEKCPICGAPQKRFERIE